MGFDVIEYSKKRKENQSSTDSTETTILKSFDVDYYSKYRNIESVGESITNRINTWLQNNNTFIDNYNKKTPLGRMAEGDDVKGIIVYLSSDASAYMNGAIIPLDGGYSAK